MTAKILIADDDRHQKITINKFFAKEIKNQEYQFLFAANGEEAINLIKDNSDIDLLVLDLKMPKKDGFAVLSFLSEYNPNLQVIIISAFGDIDSYRSAFQSQSNVKDFLAKPYNLIDFKQVFTKILAQQEISKTNLLKSFQKEPEPLLKERIKALSEQLNQAAKVEIIEYLLSHLSYQHIVNLKDTYMKLLVEAQDRSLLTSTKKLQAEIERLITFFREKSKEKNVKLRIPEDELRQAKKFSILEKKQTSISNTGKKYEYTYYLLNYGIPGKKTRTWSINTIDPRPAFPLLFEEYSFKSSKQK